MESGTIRSSTSFHDAPGATLQARITPDAGVPPERCVARLQRQAAAIPTTLSTKTPLQHVGTKTSEKKASTYISRFVRLGAFRSSSSGSPWFGSSPIPATLAPRATWILSSPRIDLRHHSAGEHA